MKLRPEVLKGPGDAARKAGCRPAASRSTWCSTAGPGSLLEEIHEAIGYGVVKMNIDTDTQYAFTRPIVDHMFKNYDGVLKVDGEIGNKKVYDPRTWGKKAELGMAARSPRPPDPA